jgi:hypothetical protein
MKTTEALQILEQALNNANLKGVYTLQDANLIIRAFSLISEQLSVPSLEEVTIKE